MKFSKKTLFCPVIFIIFSIFPVSIFAQVEEQDDPFYVKLLEDGKYFYSGGNYSEAIGKFEIAFFGFLDSPSRLVECYVYLTVCYSQTKNMEKAKFYLDEIKRLNLQEHLKILKTPGDLLDKYYEIASYFSRFESPKTAAPTAPSTTVPTYPTTLIPLPSKEKLEAEIKQLKKAIKSNARNSESYFRLATIYIEQKKLKEAKELLEALIKIEPKNGFAHFELGKIHLAQKKEREALVQFLKAAPFLPGNIELHYEMARIYYNLKAYEQARQEFEGVKKINENYKETEKYLKLLEGMRKGEETRGGSWQDLVNLARREKNFDKKMGYYLQAVENEPSNPEIRSEVQSAYLSCFEMSSAYQVAKKYKEAASLLETLLKYYPKDIEIYTKLGDIYLNDKSFDKALNILGQGKKISDNHLELRYFLGKAHLAKKNYREAAAEFGRVLAQSANYKDTPQLYRLCIEKLKK